MSRRAVRDLEINPYIAFTDLAFTLVLVLVMVVVTVTLYGRIGWDDIKYKQAQASVRTAVIEAYPRKDRPFVNNGRNDPPGAQRWVFAQANLFRKGTATLTPSGRAVLLQFAGVVQSRQTMWRRLRIEGHTLPNRSGQQDEWLLSAQRAEQVAVLLQGAGHVPSYRMAIAGRAGQNPSFPSEPMNPANERVEILIEYAQKAQ